MTDRFFLRRLPMIRLACASAVLLCAATAAHAQGLRLPGAGSAPVQPSAPAQQQQQATADYIVALVNSEPITNNDVRQRLAAVEQQLAQRDEPRPPRDQLSRQVLEQLINERVQLQQATQLGITVSEADITQAEHSIAAQNQLSPDAFRARLAAEGIDINQLRGDLRNQLLLQRVRERQVDAQVRVTEADIDDFIREQQDSNDLSSLELNLGHVLVSVPEDASPERVKALEDKARGLAERARAGADFAELARESSDAPERASGGALGLRPATRLPALFVDATRALGVGAIAGPLRSPAGFHILKVLDKQQAGLPDANVVQTRARHILLRPSGQLSQQEAIARLQAWREQIASGQARFEALAREHGQDGTASQGGDLGWASPGQFVPEFEQAMNSLQPGQVSQPVVSRFGVHLIEVQERRQATLSQREQREIVRGLVREKKADEALQAWAEDVRGRAFVEHREAPQP